MWFATIVNKQDILPAIVLRGEMTTMTEGNGATGVVTVEAMMKI
jgi:hypothetical protein